MEQSYTAKLQNIMAPAFKPIVFSHRTCNKSEGNFEGKKIGRKHTRKEKVKENEI